MRLVTLLMILMQLEHAWAQDASAPAAAPPGAAPATEAPAAGSSDYEIDYEEEPEAGDESASEGDEEPAPAKPAKKAKAKKKAPPPKVVDKFAPTSQGTRSRNKFAPLLKSDTKSVYKRNGKQLDVDAD